MNTKICGHCKKDKPLDQFYKHTGKKDNVTYSCKQCFNERKKKVLSRPKFEPVKNYAEILAEHKKRHAKPDLIELAKQKYAYSKTQHS